MTAFCINGYPVTMTKNKRGRGWTATLVYPSPTDRPLFGDGPTELDALASLLHQVGWDDDRRGLIEET